MANWYIFDASGKKWGPITKTQLIHLVANRKVAPETLVESPDGRHRKAKEINGIVFPPTSVSVRDTDVVLSSQTYHVIMPFILGGICVFLILSVVAMCGWMFSPGLHNSTVVIAEPPNLIVQADHFQPDLKKENHPVRQAEEPSVLDADALIEAVMEENGDAELAPQIPNATKSIEEVVEQSEPSVAHIKGRQGSGTGFLIRPNVVATNKHVIEDGFLELVEITFTSAPEAEKGPHRTKLLYTDPKRDIAFLEVRTPLQPLPLDVKNRFRRGQEIVIIGNPHGLLNAVNVGVLSSQEEIDGQMYHQLGASINSGNSGGPVLNRSGEVIGMATLSLVGRGIEGISFCIPIQEVMASLSEMDKLTDDEKDAQGSIHQATVNSMHRARTAFGKLIKAHEGYVACMKLIDEASNQAFRTGLLPSDGLDAVAHRVKEATRRIEDDLPKDVISEIQRVLRDKNLPDPLRKDLTTFFINCMDIRDYINNPRGLGISYSQKRIELENIGTRLKMRLKKALDMPDEE